MDTNLGFIWYGLRRYLRRYSRHDPYFLKMYLKDRKDVTINELAILQLLTKYDNLLNSIDYLKANYSDINNQEYFYILTYNDNYFMLISNEISNLDFKFKVVIKENIEDAISNVAKELKEGK